MIRLLTRTGERVKGGPLLWLLGGVRAHPPPPLKSKVLSPDIHTEALLMLTDISGVAVDYGERTKRFLRRLTLEGVENHLVHEPFSAGSMGP